MYEVDFTGWTRTPEAIKELKENDWKRWKFHFRRLFIVIINRKWYSVLNILKDVITNTKSV